MLVTARILLNKNGTITAMSGKVEEGQGPRAELTQAAAEELRVPADQIHLVMADTDLVPDDGITAGSRTTPLNVPEMRRAAATARELLTQSAAEQWHLEANILEVRNGTISNPSTGKSMTYADLATHRDIEKILRKKIRSDVELTSIDQWTALGRSLPRPNTRDLVTGTHRFPSDIVRPGMMYGKILRPPSYGATLESIDISSVEEGKEVVVVHDNQFVGVAAPSSHRASQVIGKLAGTAVWNRASKQISNNTLATHLKRRAQKARARIAEEGSPQESLQEAARSVSSTYTLAYIQHAPMEPRAAVAEWDREKLTVWTGCDGPFRARNALAREFGIPENRVRVIVPDMGGGFGGKHTAEAALEAARLARATGRPVKVSWTRAEEFTWAYCRPAAVIECRAGLKEDGSITSWDFTNINAGGAAAETPYSISNTRIATIPSRSPLPQGSYRCLGATGNNFARESFMDELAASTNADPLEFRLAHLSNQRLRRVLEEATKRFGWTRRLTSVTTETGIGLACGTEKNSVVAACVEVKVDRDRKGFRVVEVCEAFECGPILNPANLESQVQGCILMGLGGALTEEILFENGRILNPRFSSYTVPRFSDVPKISVHLLNNPEIPPAGGGETPIIAVAPAVGNAIFAATGERIRSMPIRFDRQ